MSKVVIIHPDLYHADRDKILLESFSSDVIPIRYTDDMTEEELFTAIGSTTTDVKQIAFMYHYPGYSTLPFFYDNIHNRLNLENPNERVKQQYIYWSNTVIDIINSCLENFEINKSKNTLFFLTCFLTCFFSCSLLWYFFTFTSSLIIIT